MAIITALTAQKKNRGRFNLFLDGKYFCSLDATAALGAGLKTGNQIDENLLKEVVYNSERASALGCALKYLGVKPCSEQQIREYLLEKGYDDGVVDVVIERLLELGYLDDRAFAEAYVKSCAGRYGNGLLRLKLKERGVGGDIVADVLPGSEDEIEAAVCMAEKYLSLNAPNKQKLYSHLFNKGFSGQSISAAMGIVGNK